MCRLIFYVLIIQNVKIEIIKCFVSQQNVKNVIVSNLTDVNIENVGISEHKLPLNLSKDKEHLFKESK